jgi:hypothetical protein
MTNQDEAERIRRDLIEKRAYELYRARGGIDGFDEADWAQAEQEIDGLPPDDDSVPDDEEEEVPGETA